jgi:hypothetical protein
MRNKTRQFLLFILFFPISVLGQDSIKSNLSVNGYFSNMQSFMFQRWDGDWTSDNLIHNRLNFKWSNITNNLVAVFELRTRFISGESVKNIPGYANLINNDNGFLRLSRNLLTGKSYILNSTVDRLYLDYTLDKLQVRIGRQRINWGQCFIWNPNDLFNSYSFFDFDYVEKPGCDAVRLEYYTSNDSKIDLATKIDSSGYVTTAILYRFNKWNYDFQLIGGLYKSKDFVIGAGWSGNILDASFRGEVSYFRPKNNFIDTTGTIVFSLESEYTFKNSLTLQGEILYNQMQNDNQYNFIEFYNMELSAQKLSFTQFSMMLGVSYPITPLFNVSLSGMYFPKINGFFVGPTLTYSVSDNIDLSFIAQSFGGQLQKGHSEYFQLGFLRLKWNF